jgi:hypothetical protein
VPPKAAAPKTPARQTPVLLLAYNRPDLLGDLIDALRPIAPPLVYVAVDGPKAGDDADTARVQATRDAVAGIDWTRDVHTRFRPVNVGLRASVSDAVTWAVAEHGQVIVMEDDVLPGRHVIRYLEHMLERYRDDERIFHVSGYNNVPDEHLGEPGPGSRLSMYPESYTWATWDRAWRHYDDRLTWPTARDGRALRRITGSRAAALRWRQNFADARAGRISTWAYRWVASMWSQDALMITPNVNLVRYVGHDDGTHTVMDPRWAELEVYDGPIEPLLRPAGPLDAAADRWTTRDVFEGTPIGVLRGVAISTALGARKALRARRARRAAATP